MNENSEILNYIPQRPPFVMVDKILDVSELYTKSSFTISPTNVFCKNGIFYEAGLIENIAQTAAAGAGFAQVKDGGTPKIGVIGAIKKLSISKRPLDDDKLITTVNIVSSFGNALIAEGQIEVQGTIIASCQVNIFIIDEPKLLQQ